MDTFGPPESCHCMIGCRFNNQIRICFPGRLQRPGTPRIHPLPDIEFFEDKIRILPDAGGDFFDSKRRFRHLPCYRKLEFAAGRMIHLKEGVSTALVSIFHSLHSDCLGQYFIILFRAYHRKKVSLR